MIVSNTTPLSNLLHLGKVSLLFDLFGTIYIPKAVADEITVFFSHDSEWIHYTENRKIIIEPISNIALVKQLVPFLHTGEAEAICLSLERKARLCLMDDRDGRTVAKMNAIPTAGTLGIVLKAKQRGMIPLVKPLLDILRDKHHFWIAPSLYGKILSLANEE